MGRGEGGGTFNMISAVIFWVKKKGKNHFRQASNTCRRICKNAKTDPPPTTEAAAGGSTATTKN